MAISTEDLIGYTKRLLDTNLILAKNKTSANGSDLVARTPFLKLKKYVNEFLEGNKEQRIIVLPGLRGVGKTTLLFQTFLWLFNTKKIQSKRLFYVSLDYLVDNMGSDINHLFDIYEKYFLGDVIEKNEKPLFLFIDEAHFSKKWELFAKNLYDRNANVFIFVSGSSAIALNTSTDTARRTIVEEITPLSFQEYLVFKKDFYPPVGTAQKIRVAINSPIEEMEFVLNKTHIALKDKLIEKGIDIKKELRSFILSGGFPGGITQNNDEATFKWIDDVLGKIISKDIPKYSDVSSSKSPYIMSILRFFSESIPPSPQSSNNILKAFKTKELSEATVRNILKALTDSCILSKLEANSSNSIKIKRHPPIYYFSTSTIRSALRWSVGKMNIIQNEYLGVVLEESIYNNLLKIKAKSHSINDIRYDYSQGACDFLLKMTGGDLAIEVGWGTKKDSQLISTMKRFDCRGGLKICNTEYVIAKDNIISIPRELLLFA